MVVWIKRALVIAALPGVVLILRTVPAPVVPQAHAQSPYCADADRPGQCTGQGGVAGGGGCHEDRPGECNNQGGAGGCHEDRPGECSGQGGGTCSRDRPDQCGSQSGSTSDASAGGQGGGGNPGAGGSSTTASFSSPGMFATVDRDSVTVFNITSSGQSGGTGSSVSTVQGQNAQFSDGEPVLVYDSSAAGQDLALTVWIELAPGVSVGGAQVSRGTIATADNRVVWRGFSLGGGAQARVNLNVAPSGISHPIRRVTVESVSTEQGEQRVTVLTPKQSGARLSAGTPRLPNTGTGGLLQPGGLASRWLAVTEVVVMLLLGVGLWSWTRLRGRQS